MADSVAKPVESRKRRAAHGTAPLERSLDLKSDVTGNASLPGSISKRQRISTNGAIGQAVSTGPQHTLKRSGRNHLNGERADGGHPTNRLMASSITDARVCYFVSKVHGFVQTLC